MSVRLLWLTGIVLLLVAGCAGGSTDERTPEVPAVDVVSDFYYWYLGYPGNVLVEGGYHDSDALTGDFIARLDDFVSQRMAYDPILCAQDLPGDYRVLPGESADRVDVQTVWNAGTEFENINTLQVWLVQIDGQWRIDAIDCQPGD